VRVRVSRFRQRHTDEESALEGGGGEWRGEKRAAGRYTILSEVRERERPTRALLGGRGQARSEPVCVRERARVRVRE
jgi:hypothetical protein